MSVKEDYVSIDVDNKREGEVHLVESSHNRKRDSLNKPKEVEQMEDSSSTDSVNLSDCMGGVENLVCDLNESFHVSNDKCHIKDTTNVTSGYLSDQSSDSSEVSFTSALSYNSVNTCGEGKSNCSDNTNQNFSDNSLHVYYADVKTGRAIIGGNYLHNMCVSDDNDSFSLSDNNSGSFDYSFTVNDLPAELNNNAKSEIVRLPQKVDTVLAADCKQQNTNTRELTQNDSIETVIENYSDLKFDKSDNECGQSADPNLIAQSTSQNVSEIADNLGQTFSTILILDDSLENTSCQEIEELTPIDSSRPVEEIDCSAPSIQSCTLLTETIIDKENLLDKQDSHNVISLESKIFKSENNNFGKSPLETDFSRSALEVNPTSNEIDSDSHQYLVNDCVNVKANSSDLMIALPSGTFSLSDRLKLKIGSNTEDHDHEEFFKDDSTFERSNSSQSSTNNTNTADTSALSSVHDISDLCMADVTNLTADESVFNVTYDNVKNSDIIVVEIEKSYLNTIKMQILQLKEQIALDNKANEECEEKLQFALTKVSSLTQQLNDMTARINHLTEDYRLLKETLSNCIKNKEEIISEHDKNDVNQSQKIHQLEMEIKDISSVKTLLEMKVEICQIENNYKIADFQQHYDFLTKDSQNKYKTLFDSHQVLSHENSNLKNEVSTLSESVTEEKNRFNKLNTKFETLKNVVDSLNNKIQDSETCLKLVQEREKHFVNNFNNILSIDSELMHYKLVNPSKLEFDEVLMMLRQKLSTVYEMCKNLEQQSSSVKNLNFECKSLKCIIDEKDRRWSELNNDYCDQLHKLKQSFIKVTDQNILIESENAELTNQIERMNKEIDKFNKEDKLICTCASEDLKKVVQELKLDLVDKNARISELELYIESCSSYYRKKAEEYRCELVKSRNLEILPKRKLSNSKSNQSSPYLKNVPKTVAKLEAGVQTDSTQPLHISSGFIEKYKIKELEEHIVQLKKDKTILSRLCQKRTLALKNLCSQK